MQYSGVFGKEIEAHPRALSLSDDCIPATEVLGCRMFSYGDDITVTLTVHRLVLSCVGIWPVKKKDLFMDLRWIIAVFLEASAAKEIIYFGKKKCTFSSIYS